MVATALIFTGIGAAISRNDTVPSAVAEPTNNIPQTVTTAAQSAPPPVASTVDTPAQINPVQNNPTPTPTTTAGNEGSSIKKQTVSNSKKGNNKRD
jgi:hypothetical protein